MHLGCTLANTEFLEVDFSKENCHLKYKTRQYLTHYNASTKHDESQSKTRVEVQMQ